MDAPADASLGDGNGGEQEVPPPSQSLAIG